MHMYTNVDKHCELTKRNPDDRIPQFSPSVWCMHVVRVIVIQKTLIEHVEKLRQVKAVLEEVIFSQQRTFWNGAGRKFLRDIQEAQQQEPDFEPNQLLNLKPITKGHTQTS
ncbi:hypothetical protein YC2023_045402 [Brassica napus]